MFKSIKLEKNKTRKVIIAMLFSVMIVGITVSNEWIILAAAILMVISSVVGYLKKK